ncbi:hypothetical protein KQ1_05838 [Bacillus cereus BAG3O-1]|nr:hypothetical protein KQ1_05838 [Bacillus cereus BAG3O-1]
MEININKINKNDPAIRKALMETYKNKCFYTGYPIDYTELEVDHIIPASVDKNSKEIQEYLKDVGKDLSFELNSVYNLVPAKYRINREKSNDLFNIDYARYVLDRAARHADDVIENIKKQRQKTKYSKHLEALRTDVYKDDKKAAEYYDFFVDDMEDFEESPPVRSQRSFFVSSKKVRLKGSLPKYPELKGNCTLTFRSLKIRNAIITLTHEEIMSQLFVGLNTLPEHQLRGFIDTPIESDGIYGLKIGKTEFSLTYDEVKELCAVVDDFGEVYLNELRILENTLGVYLFEESNHRINGYKLIKIKRDLWRELIDFACINDYDNGESKWHIFQANGLHIHVNSKNKNSRYDSGTHVKLFAEQEYAKVDLKIPDEDVWIVWEPPFSTEFENTLENVNERQLWDLNITYNWLIKEFIPEVLKHIGSKKSDFYYKSGKKVNFPRIEQIRSMDNLLMMVEDLQQTFYGYEGNLFFTKKIIKDLYSSIAICLARTSLGDYTPIKFNLSIKNAENVEEIVQHIEQISMTIEDEIYRSRTLSNLISCLVIPLRNGNSHLNDYDIQKIIKLLRDLFKEKQLLDYIMKYKNK